MSSENTCDISNELSTLNVTDSSFIGNRCNVGNILCAPRIHSEYVLSRLHLLDIVFQNDSTSYTINNYDLSNHTYRINMMTDTNNDNFCINLPDAPTIAEGVHYTFYITDNGNIGQYSNILTFNFGSGHVYGNIIANGVTITVNAYLENTGVNSLFGIALGNVADSNVIVSIDPNQHYTQNKYYNGVQSLSFNVRYLSLGDKIEVDFTGAGRWMVSGVLNNTTATM